MNLTHGHTKGRISPTYKSWQSMISRCTNANAPDYQRYGDRGITVCERWLKFENFLADMGERPLGCTLDRERNSGNYEPGNCRWATTNQQQRNRRSNRFLEHRGLRLTVAEWAERTGICNRTILARLRGGWSVERALTERPIPPMQRRAAKLLWEGA